MNSTISLITLFLTLQIILNWEPVQIDNGGFKCQMPSQPETRESIAETSAGDVLVNTIYCVSSVDSTDNYLYLINYHLVPQGLFTHDSMEMNYEFLEEMLNDLIISLDGEILYSNRTYLKKYPVIEYRMNLQNEEKQVKGRLILTADNFYSIQVFTTKQFAGNWNPIYK